jgi:predicted metal-dependent RNase
MSHLRFLALGGAEEIGASSYYIGTERAGILLDCGVRIGLLGEAALPRLELLRGLPLEAVLITHAHLDHLGGLPFLRPLLAEQGREEVPIYATTPTRRLASPMLLDQSKIWRLSGCDLLNEGLALRAASEIIPLEPGTEVEGKDFRAILHPAGHILGAAYIILEIDGFKALFTGDISLTKQGTVSEAQIDQGEEVDVVVTESTYGNCTLPSRKNEVKALISQILEVLQRGGRILIPSFALGRAQEVVLILLQHIASGILPRVPIYLDGLVREITKLYEALSDYFPEELQSFCKNSRQPPLLRPPVELVDDRLRERLITERKPAVIIASSGMLQGGVSPIYSRTIASEEESGIFIVGYQDEDSPGRRLLEAKRGDELEIMGEAITLSCEVTQFKLSAHADRGQLLNFLSRFPSQSVVIVHGEGSARHDLYNSLKGERFVWLARAGEAIDPLAFPERKPSYQGASPGEAVRAIGMKVEGKVTAGHLLELPEEASHFFEGIERVTIQLWRRGPWLRLDGRGQTKGEPEPQAGAKIEAEKGA